MAVGKDAPSVTIGTESDYKKLFFSDSNSALIVPVTLSPGWGKLDQGTALALNGSALSTGNKGKYLPYDPHATNDGTLTCPARAYLTQSSGTTASILYVTLDDSYKFKVGDDAFIVDNVTAAENLGAITAIDRTTYANYAAITVTTATGGTSFTTARRAYLYVEGADVCTGVLVSTKDTGTGSTAVGAQGLMLISNALVYTGMLTNFDTNAGTDMGSSSIGQYTLFK